MALPISELERLAALTDDEEVIEAAIKDNVRRIRKILSEKQSNN